jgi:hypothetical protein
MFETIRSLVDFADRFSVTSLIAIATVFAIALLFSVREAAAWFFKVDDIKRDIKAVHDLVLELESEVRSLQNQSNRLKPSLVRPEPAAEHRTEQSSALRTPVQPAKERPSFPISH